MPLPSHCAPPEAALTGGRTHLLQVSDGAKSGMAGVRLLLSFDRVSRTAPGLDRLRDRGLLTDLEYEAPLPPSPPLPTAAS